MIDLIWKWLESNWLELFSVISALVYLAFSIRQIIYLWPVGILSSALFVYVFFDANLYADMGLSIYYVLVSIYGWHNWYYGAKSGKTDDLKIRTCTKQNALTLVGVGLVLYVGIAWCLLHLPEMIGIPKAALPYLDAFTTATSIVATWMLTKKYLEQWIIWVVVDLVSMGMYIYKGLYPTSGLFFFYTIMAVVGYIQWKDSWKKIQKFAY